MFSNPIATNLFLKNRLFFFTYCAHHGLLQRWNINQTFECTLHIESFNRTFYESMNEWLAWQTWRTEYFTIIINNEWETNNNNNQIKRERYRKNENSLMFDIINMKMWHFVYVQHSIVEIQSISNIFVGIRIESIAALIGVNSEQLTLNMVRISFNSAYNRNVCVWSKLRS